MKQIYKELLGFLFVGYGILISAIAINYIFSLLGITTWYEFLTTTGDRFGTIGIIDGVALFVIYPFVLGIAGVYSLVLYRTRIINR